MNGIDFIKVAVADVLRSGCNVLLAFSHGKIGTWKLSLYILQMESLRKAEKDSSKYRLSISIKSYHGLDSRLPISLS